MYLKLKLEASQNVLIQSVIEEAIRVAKELDIMVEFHYHGHKIQVDSNSNARDIYTDWKNKINTITSQN
ncbi:MAG: hypothetical protein H8E98_02590 [Bacteroidetes bacterium]|nr:hypothetical protein [Bacteroidota bacterium]